MTSKNTFSREEASIAIKALESSVSASYAQSIAYEAVSVLLFSELRKRGFPTQATTHVEYVANNFDKVIAALTRQESIIRETVNLHERDAKDGYESCMEKLKSFTYLPKPKEPKPSDDPSEHKLLDFSRKTKFV